MSRCPCGWSWYVDVPHPFGPCPFSSSLPFFPSVFATVEIVLCWTSKMLSCFNVNSMFLQVLKIEFCLYFFKKNGFSLDMCCGRFGRGAQLNCILPLCLPLDIWREGLKWFGIKPLWSTFHLYGQDRTSIWGAIRSRQWYASYSINWTFW